MFSTCIRDGAIYLFNVLRKPQDAFLRPQYEMNWELRVEGTGLLGIALQKRSTKDILGIREFISLEFKLMIVSHVGVFYPSLPIRQVYAQLFFLNSMNLPASSRIGSRLTPEILIEFNNFPGGASGPVPIAYWKIPD